MKNCTMHTTGTLGQRWLFLGVMVSIALAASSVSLAQLAKTAVTPDGNAVTRSATTTAVGNGPASGEFALYQNSPNPFNPSTSIQYNLGKSARVSLRIYNLLGNEVATLVDALEDAGSYTVTFNSDKGTLSFASGVYFYRLEAGSFVSTKKLVIMK
jgi:hypothetical protein